MGCAIEITGLRYAYPKNEVLTLNGVDLQIPEGAFTIITGPTGAGKTTLVFSMNGIVPELTEGRIAGQIRVFDKNVRQSRVQDLLSRIGVVMQDPETQIFGRTVQEDAEFGPRNMMLPRAEILQRVKQSLEMVRLDGFQDRETDQLSGGEKQRLAIAGILAMRPRMMVLDEPTSELDPLGRAEIYQTVQALRQEGDMTIVGIEHSTQDIVEYADHLVVVQEGRIVWNGIPSELLRDISLTRSLGLKPIPVSLLGWELVQAGLIEAGEIPLNLDAAESLLRGILNGKSLSAFQRDSEPTTQMGRAVLEIEQLTHLYEGGVQALNGIELTIREGEFVALIGQNGAGKTTLAKHLNGLLQPTQGSIRIEGKDTRTTPTHELAKVIGYVFQNPDHQIFSVTVADEIRYGLKNLALIEDEIQQRVTEIAELTGLTALLAEHPLSLGKGQRQMVAVASILSLRPKILVIDEPTTGQDWMGIQNMMALIKDLHRQGTTIIMISHDMDIVAEYADRVIVLTHGEVKADGQGERIFRQHQVLHDACVAAPQIPTLCHRLKDLMNGASYLTPQGLSNAVISSLGRLP